MAKFCKKCEKKLGFLEGNEGMCSDCYKIHVAEQKKIEEERMAAEREKIKERRNQMVQNIRLRIQRGESVFLYKHIYLDVDSYVFEKDLNNGPNLSQLVGLGLSGWEMTGIIHKTISIELSTTYSGDSHGKAWGGSTGGVSGAYAILRRQIKNNEDISDEELFDYASMVIS